MLMIGRLPTFGIYVQVRSNKVFIEYGQCTSQINVMFQMFTTVAKNFSKFLAAYFCLLVAFALSFCVLFPNYQSFNVNAPAAVVKTLVMMAGEIEYENFIYENGNALYNFTGHVMIMIFVVLVSIILMNLLVGLAVSDIQVRFYARMCFDPPSPGQYLVSLKVSVQTFVRMSALKTKQKDAITLHGAWWITKFARLVFI